ncbi:MAG: hypothetical protein AAGN35_07085 [Bacteroidota bacterium]
MKSRDDLFHLIASLNRAEKRYFKVFAGRHVIGKQNRYVRLFDLIDRQSEYEPDKLRKAYPGNLSSDKNYLKKLILKSMRAYRDGGHVRTRLAEMIEEVHFLKEKGLYNQAIRRLKKARQTAEDFQCYFQLMEILDLERRLIKQTVDSNLLHEHEQLVDGQRRFMQSIATELELAQLYDRVFLFSRTGKTESDLLSAEDLERLRAPLPVPEDYELSRETHLQYHSSRAIYFNLRKEYAASLAEIQRLVEWYETSPQLMEKHPERYKIALSNLLVAANEVEEYGNFPVILEKIRALPTASFDEEAESFQNVAFLELMYFMNSGQFDAVPALSVRVDQGLDLYAAKINQARQHAICLNLSLAFFIREEMREALSWLGRILNRKEGDQRQDIQQAARILQLVIHLELGNFDLIHSLLRSTRRYLDLRQGMGEYEKALIAFFRQAITSPPGKVPSGLYRHTIAELKRLQAESQWSALLLCDEIVIWLQARLSGQKLKVAYRG